MTAANESRAALVIDPDPAIHAAVGRALAPLGLRMLGATAGVDGLTDLYQHLPGVVVLGIELPDAPLERMLDQIRRTAERAAVVVLAASSQAERAVAAGADPASMLAPAVVADDPSRLAGVVARLAGRATPPVAPWERERAEFFSRRDLIFRHSEAMRAVERLVVKVADTDAPVLLEGESGVGKEQVARAIHYLSPRGGRPWVKLSCASIPPAHLERELFGHQTGLGPETDEREQGRMELADGGTLFLDEIDEVPSAAQANLLRVLRDRAFHPPGGRKPMAADVRLLVATSKSLSTLLTAGLFDEDLYLRLSTFRIAVPPLRDRHEEVPLLLEHFRGVFARQFGRPGLTISPAVLDLLRLYTWPGNVRELESMMKRFVVLGEERSLKEEVESRLRAFTARQRAPEAGRALPGIGLRDIARRAAREAERAAIREVLERVQGNRAAAARLLRISYKTLLHKLDQEGFSRSLVRKGRRTPSDG